MPDLPIALSAGPLTQPCADAARQLLAGLGWGVTLYAADGQGGRDLEADVRSGRVAGVLDLTLTELAAELLGLPGGAGLDRLTAAALCGVPQLIVLAGLDAVQVRDMSRSVAEFAGAWYSRTTPEENDRLGREIAHKASAARGPTAILIPGRGLSALDIEGGPFWWPQADGRWFRACATGSTRTSEFGTWTCTSTTQPSPQQR